MIPFPFHWRCKKNNVNDKLRGEDSKMSASQVQNAPSAFQGSRLSGKNKVLFKRVGKDVVVVHDEKAQILSHDQLNSLIDNVTQLHDGVKIETAGLSRSQVDMIAGSFKRNPQIEVEVRPIIRSSSSSRRLHRFEIVIRNGEK